MIPMLVERVKELNALGFNDGEISVEIKVSRATVNRCRQEHGIPKSNPKNRMDKVYTCTFCQREVVIRRKERKKRYCDTCREVLKKK